MKEFAKITLLLNDNSAVMIYCLVGGNNGKLKMEVKATFPSSHITKKNIQSIETPRLLNALRNYYYDSEKMSLEDLFSSINQIVKEAGFYCKYSITSLEYGLKFHSGTNAFQLTKINSLLMGKIFSSLKFYYLENSLNPFNKECRCIGINCRVTFTNKEIKKRANNLKLYQWQK